MPKINNLEIYPIDGSITLDDFLLGSDADNIKKTKNYPVGSLIHLIQESQGISTLTFKYRIGTDYNASGFFFTNADKVSFDEISTFYFNKINATGVNVSGLLSVLVSSPNHLALKIAKPNNPNVFAYFSVVGHVEYANYFKIDVELLNNAFFGELDVFQHFSLSVDVVSIGDEIDSNLKLIKIDSSNLETQDIEGLVKYLNTVAGFVKTSMDQIMFEVSTGVTINPKVTRKYFLVNKRKGTYGLGGVLLDSEDIVLIDENIIPLTSSDQSITIDNNDIIVNTEGWALDNDLNTLTPNIQI